jgi:hypothetical protein
VETESRAPRPTNGQKRPPGDMSALGADPRVARCLEHVHHLSAVIGPRGSATESEAEAAAYARVVLERAGLEPRVERFRSAVSEWRPFALAATLSLLAVALYPLAGRVTAVLSAIIAAVAVASAYLELNFTPNPLRWLLPKRPSQNVWALIPPANSPRPDGRPSGRQRVVLVGHLDTHRTPFVFGSPARLKVFGVLVAAAFASMAALVILYVIGAVMQHNLLYIISMAPAAVLVLVLLMTLQADATPYTAGANDNATGAAVVLALAERLQKEPLANTEVWALNSGCEEVGCYGAAAFVREHREELRNAYFIALDSVGGPGTGPCYITREGMTKPYRSDPGLVALCDRIAAERPDLGAYPHVMSLGFTEGGIGIKSGLRTLTFVNLTPDGVLPYWHRPDDTFENVDPDVLARTQEFLWELLQRLDAA